MGLDNPQIHLPGTLKQQNKAHKHWHRSKGSVERLNKGRALLLKGSTKRRKQELKREERKNQDRQARKKKRFEYLQKRRGFCEAPFLVAVIPLHNDIKVEDIISLLKNADPDAIINCTSEGHIHMKSPRMKQKFTFVSVITDNLFDQLDIVKVCTTLLLLTSVKGISPEGNTTLEAILAQGLPTTVVAVTDLDTLPQKKWAESKSSIQQEIEHMIPDEKVMQLNREMDAMNILRKISTQKQRTILQRDRRPHLLAESIHFIETEKGKGTLSVTGYLRGRNLSGNSLVHIPGWGEFQIVQIDSAPFLGDEMTEIKVLEQPDRNKQESLVSENVPDSMDAEQTWPTEEEMQEASVKKVKKIPKGISEYQAAWIPDEDAIEVEDVDNEDDDDDDEGMDVATAMSEEASSSSSDEYETVTIASEPAPNPEKYDEDIDMNEEATALEKLKRAKEDLEFPDEVDTPQDMVARERFARYRGLASFRTTPWDPKENLPVDYARIFQFQNFDRTKAAILANEPSGAQAGWYITVHLKDVPTVLYQMRGEQPVVLYGMLPHEVKMSVVNLVLHRNSSFSDPVKSKESLLFQVGYRRFRASPIFSQHTSGSKHKYERFFQPESIVVATIFAPVIFPPASVLVFKENKDRTISTVASGNVLSVNPNRIVVKRVVLSGHPFKVLKRSAIVRFMFFNRQDIEWFKPVELRSKYGRRGHIKEPLGTHGHMKCVFNTQLKSQDTILMHLYKRVFPKWTYDPCVTFAPLS